MRDINEQHKKALERAQLVTITQCWQVISIWLSDPGLAGDDVPSTVRVAVAIVKQLTPQLERQTWVQGQSESAYSLVRAMGASALSVETAYAMREREELSRARAQYTRLQGELDEKRGLIDVTPARSGEQELKEFLES